MSFDEKFTAIRKGLLEFLLLKIIAGAQVYAADILQQLEAPNSPRRKARCIRS